MKIKTELYIDSLKRLPKTGQHILGFQEDDLIVVYQAFRQSIADFAVKNQYFGGEDYSFSRMSWIKPNFLWMMYRCGWLTKENQQKVLAIWIDKSDFESILNEAVFTSFNDKYYSSQEEWKEFLKTKDVRLQWDPDHNPYGDKLERRAIQLGLQGKTLQTFAKDKIKLIEDISDFVEQQREFVEKKQLDKLLIPYETVFKPSDEKSGKKNRFNDSINNKKNTFLFLTKY